MSALRRFRNIFLVRVKLGLLSSRPSPIPGHSTMLQEISVSSVSDILTL